MIIFFFKMVAIIVIWQIYVDSIVKVISVLAKNQTEDWSMNAHNKLCDDNLVLTVEEVSIIYCIL